MADDGGCVEPDYRFTLANERTFLAWQRTALGLLGLEAVEFGEHVHGQTDVVIREAGQARGVVQQNVRIQDEVLHRLVWRPQTEIRRLRLFPRSVRLSPDSSTVLDFFEKAGLDVLGTVDHGLWR